MTQGIPETEKPRVGISACLLGERVRYDGGHKRDDYLMETLAKLVEWVPACPEVECGLGVPREPMHLAGDPQNPRLVTRKTGVDHTDRMKQWAVKRLRELEQEDLDGFVFKARSPSCAMRGVEVHDRDGVACGVCAGLWAGAFMERFPQVPVAEEGELHDARACEAFVARVTSRARRRSSQGP